jgi:hypothetical protein
VISARSLAATLVFAASFAVLATDRTADTTPPPRAFVGATLVDGTGRPPVSDAVVLVRGGVYEAIVELHTAASH